MGLDKEIELAIEVVKAIALLVSGLWVAWTFQKLQKIRAANLDILERNSRLRGNKIEQQANRTKLLAQQPQLHIDFSVIEERSAAGQSLLCVNVSLANQGEQNLIVVFGPDTLTIAKVGFAERGIPSTRVIHRTYPTYLPDDKNEPQPIEQRMFRVGQKRNMAMAVVPVSTAAIYLLQFSVIYYRYPFDGEKATKDEPTLINAVEQTFFVPSSAPVRSRSRMTSKREELAGASDSISRHPAPGSHVETAARARP